MLFGAGVTIASALSSTLSITNYLREGKDYLKSANETFKKVRRQIVDTLKNYNTILGTPAEILFSLTTLLGGTLSLFGAVIGWGARKIIPSVVTLVMGFLGLLYIAREIIEEGGETTKETGRKIYATSFALSGQEPPPSYKDVMIPKIKNPTFIKKVIAYPIATIGKSLETVGEVVETTSSYITNLFLLLSIVLIIKWSRE